MELRGCEQRHGRVREVLGGVLFAWRQNILRGHGILRARLGAWQGGCDERHGLRRVPAGKVLDWQSAFRRAHGVRGHDLRGRLGCFQDARDDRHGRVHRVRSWELLGWR